MRALLSLLVLLFMAGCTASVRPPEIDLRTAPVKVKAGVGGGFCPPGQAKKGNC